MGVVPGGVTWSPCVFDVLCWSLRYAVQLQCEIQQQCGGNERKQELF